MPKLFEALTKNPEYQSLMPELLERAKSNLIVNAVMREAILKDTANALGKMHDVIIDSATPVLSDEKLSGYCQQPKLWFVFPKQNWEKPTELLNFRRFGLPKKSMTQ